MTFKNEADYDKVKPRSQVTLQGVKELAPGSEVTMICKDLEGKEYAKIPLVHSFNEGQIGWHRAGSALNLMAAKAKQRAASA